MTTEWASAQAVEDATTRWSPGQIECRTYGHGLWRPHTVTHRPGQYTVYQRCPRCYARRKQRITESGYPLSGWQMDYHEADGYLLKGVGRVGPDGKAVLRLAALRGHPVIEEPDD